MNRLVFAALAASLIASPALALDTQDRMPVKMRVQLKGVDVNTPAGAAVALARINKAARWTCTLDNAGRGTRTIDEICVHEMTTRAVASLNSPQVLALLQSKQPDANS